MAAKPGQAVTARPTYVGFGPGSVWLFGLIVQANTNRGSNLVRTPCLGLNIIKKRASDLPSHSLVFTIGPPLDPPSFPSPLLVKEGESQLNRQ